MASNEENYIDLICFRIPRANRIIRVFFSKQWRKHANEEWKNTPDEGKAFATGVGRRAWTTSSRRQKTLLERGDIYLWDLGLCNHVLQKTDFGVNGLSEREKTLLNDLAMLQNDIHRNYKPTMTKDEHESKTKQIEHILKQFEPSIEELLSGLKLTNPGNEITASRLKEVANSLFNEKKYQDALRCYNQAIEMSGMPNQLLGELYSNRSAVYSMIADGEDTVGSALEDAKRAVQLLPEWFRGYYRLGCAYQLLEIHEKAFKYFSIALELQPDKTDIIPLRDECEKKIPKPKSPREILLGNEICSYQDLADLINARCGTRMTPDELTQFLNFGDKNMPEFCLFKAVNLMSFGELQDYNEIFELLWKAAENSTMALYYIAIMYGLGVGVEIDVKKSIQLLKQVASSRKSPVCTSNSGIGFAENYLGYMYAKGIGLPIDLEESVRFYQRAFDNGNRSGALNLGLSYLNGTGVECNEVKGVQYLKHAAKLFDSNAMLILARYYLVKAQDARQALEWHQRAVSHGNIEAISNADEFKSEIKLMKRRFAKIDKGMSGWEENTGLAADMSVKERRERFVNESCPGASELLEKVSGIMGKFDKQHLPFSNKVYKFDVKVLEDFSKKGSITARELKKALVNFNLSVDFFKRGRIVECVHHLAESICISELVVDSNFCSMVVAMTEEMGVDLTILASNFDRDLRVCLTMNHLMSFEQTANFLIECIRIFPDFVWFRQILASTYGFLHDTTNGLKVINSALEKFPDNYHLWYIKAVFLHQSEKTNKKALMRAYEKYLSLAPSDERKVPRIYYMMGMRAKGGKNEAEKYYKMGLEAEKLQLPYFLPVECAEKSLLESITGLFVPTERTREPPVVVNELIDTKLTDPGRIATITTQRSLVESMFIQTRSGNFLVKSTWGRGMAQTAPSSLSDIRPITLREMDPWANRIYAQRALSCVVIDEPSLGMNGVHVIVEDGNGDVERVTVYNIDQDEWVRDKLGYGCRITIRNPYFKIAMDGKQIIRVDDVESVVFECGQDVSRCRYCGKTGSVMKCGRCHRANYCSKQCQVNDWKILKHKLICYSNLS